MARNRKVVSRLRLGAQGRTVIPAKLRRALGLSDGDELVAWLEGDRLVIRSKESVAKDLRGSYKHVGPDRDLAAELIAERRAEAASEAQRG
jgi:AbrB family looped-hinge helix DNA binding protein